MRMANINGRLALILDSGAVDVAMASNERFQADPQAVFDRWAEFRDWAAHLAHSAVCTFEDQDLRAPAPCPRQVFGIGLNYLAHAEETSLETPEFPHVFTKFPSCITGQDALVPLVSESVDWEVELVVVIGTGGNGIGEADAWSHVAGLAVGQDLSERGIMLNSRPWPQISLGKSYPGFGPIGPYLVTPDELDNPDDLAISCLLNGEKVQDAGTGEMIFGVPTLISKLSSIVSLFPGDVIFTGTPAGVGVALNPPRFLQPRDTLLSTVEGIGTLRTRLG
jgi:2-keto-4-pentenoate hydratase/2-oxohepta-3-ene-1,7-dioic acid hydratase in catechol pathway